MQADQRSTMRISASMGLGLVLAGCPASTVPDCSVCNDDELCAYTYDFDGSLSPVECVSWPSVCTQDQTCECINETPWGKSKNTSPDACGELGWEQNSNACTVIDDRPAVECVSTLG